jgi:hypothetical protein
LLSSHACMSLSSVIRALMHQENSFRKPFSFPAVKRVAQNRLDFTKHLMLFKYVC